MTGRFSVVPRAAGKWPWIITRLGAEFTGGIECRRQKQKRRRRSHPAERRHHRRRSKTTERRHHRRRSHPAERRHHRRRSKTTERRPGRGGVRSGYVTDLSVRGRLLSCAATSAVVTVHVLAVGVFAVRVLTTVLAVLAPVVLGLMAVVLRGVRAPLLLLVSALVPVGAAVRCRRLRVRVRVLRLHVRLVLALVQGAVHGVEVLLCEPAGPLLMRVPYVVHQRAFCPVVHGDLRDHGFPFRSVPATGRECSR